MPSQFIEFGETSYPIPVILIIGHTWLWLESRSKFVNIKTSLHLYGLLTGFLGFLPGMVFYIVPNIFVIIVGMVLVGRFVTEDKERKKQKEEYLEKNKEDEGENEPNELIGRLKGMFKRGR